MFPSGGLLESFLPIDEIGGLPFGPGFSLGLHLFGVLVVPFFSFEFSSDSVLLFFGKIPKLRVAGVGKDNGGVARVVDDLVGFGYWGASFRSPISIRFLEHFLPYHVVLGKIAGVSIALNKEKGMSASVGSGKMNLPMKRLPIGRDRGIQKCISEVQDPIP